MIDMAALRAFLVDVVAFYELSAPTVSAWADDLYIRLGEDLAAVRMIEPVTAQMLRSEGEWEHPNYAANRVYKVMHSLGQDVSGHAGF